MGATVSRRTVLESFLFSRVSLLAQAPGSPANDSARLLQRMLAALGGAKHLAAVRDVDWTVLAKTWNGNGAVGPEITRRIRWIWPDIYRKDQRAGRISVVEFFDGAAGWEVVPDGGFLTLKDKELEFVRREVIGFSLETKLAKADRRYKLSAPAESVLRVDSSSAGGPAIDIEIDIRSGLPLRRLSTSLSGSPSGGYREVRQRMEILSWQNVADLRWVTRTQNFHDDAKRADITTTEVRINTGLEAEELSRRP